MGGQDDVQNEKIKNVNEKFTLMLEQNQKEHKDFKNTLESINNKIDGIDKKFDNFKGEADKRYAPIWVKQILVWFGASVGGILILYIANLIIKMNSVV